jgi:uncharacterized protein (UPF0332 family)
MRLKSPDKKSAMSLVIASENQMKYTLTIDPTNESAFTIIRNIYECFQMIEKAILLSEGKVSEDHIESIKAIESLNIKTERPIKLIDNLRKIRHGINYYGYCPKKEEAEDAINFAKQIFYKLLASAKDKIK